MAIATRPTITALLLCVLAVASVAQPSPGFHPNGGELSEAEEFVAQMKQLGLVSGIMLIDAEAWSHKVVLFEYPAESGQIWAWDANYRSMPLGSIDMCSQSVQVADLWMRRTQQAEEAVNVQVSGCQ